MKKLLPLLIATLLLLFLVACDTTPSTDGGDGTLPTDSEQKTTHLFKTYSSTNEYGNAGEFTEINAQYSVGDAIELEATVKSGYNFVGWFISGTCVSEDLKYTFTMGSNDVNIEARYSYYTVLTSSDSDDYSKAGTYTELKNKKISVGEQVAVEATVNTGYNFEGWFINNTCVSEELTYSFVMKEQNVELEARWNYYTVSVGSNTDEQGTAGSFTEMNDKKISVGDAVKLNATVNDGFNFEGWYINGNHVSSDFEYNFTMKAENVDIEAVYSYYCITVESWSDEQGMAGTYPKKSNEKISAGETVTLTATVADGYNFEGWYVDGVCVCSDLTYQFVMEKSNKTIGAEYSYYTFTSNGFLSKWGYGNLENVQGTFTKYNYEKVSVGDEVVLVATVGDGYTFEGWYINDVCVSEDLEYTYTMEKRSVEVVAIFTYYTVSTQVHYYHDGWTESDIDDVIGTYTEYDEEKVRVGDTVTLTATVGDGYRFVGWEHNGTIVTENLIYTFQMSAEDDTYVAVFEKL